MKANASIRTLTLLAAVSLSATASVHATTVGLTPNTSTPYAVWDTFPLNTPSFTGRTPDTTGTGITALTLDVASSGIVTGSNGTVGDRLYLAGQPSTWAARGTTGTAPKTFSLQLKNFMYTSQSLTQFFSASLTIGGITYVPDSSATNIVPEGGNNSEILTWTWNTSLANNTGTNFTFNFASTTGAQLSIDGFDVSVGAVPEPSTYAALAAGGAALLLTVKRRRRALA